MLHDRFHARWDQPIDLLQGGDELSAFLEITIDRNGRIANLTLSKSSGNRAMDDSVMTAARRITQVDALPKGLGNTTGYKVNIEFKLNQ